MKRMKEKEREREMKVWFTSFYVKIKLNLYGPWRVARG
jgi:hypothetical protein